MTGSRAGSRRVDIALLTIALLAGAACADRGGAVATASAAGRLGASADSGNAREAAREAAGGTPQLRLVNALPGADGAGLAQGTGGAAELFSGVDYKSVTPYVAYLDDAPLGRLQLRTPDGTPVTTNALDVSLDAGERYSLVAVSAGTDSVRLQLVRDDLTPPDGRARIRVIHALRGEGPLTVRAGGVAEPVLGAVTFGADVGHADIEPVETTIVVRGDESGRELMRRKVKLVAGHAYTIVITGDGGRRVDAIVIDDQVTATR